MLALWRHLLVLLSYVQLEVDELRNELISLFILTLSFIYTS